MPSGTQYRIENGEVFSVRQLAEIFDVITETVLDWIAQGKFPNASKIGKKWYVPADDVRDLMERGRK